MYRLLVAAIAGLALDCVPATVAAQTIPPNSVQRPTYTVAMETTLRPDYTNSGTVIYSPIPLTPNLGQLADSVASQPSVAKAMRDAKVGNDSPTAHAEL
ncbi:hypothetical protein FBU31_001827 [Coemansia sp. 'formosensis']|uniref:Uncharacterized protein n=1 Tax=Coemansia furcata TaxID=417177 RepID=A0ACC1L680_9FUNG|nr:hypothetical protein H4S07_004862 [Coemansia furcata]KAJ2834023.1 hypothetical protein FBU31_001827 [Coemansia sp. 'formosensis']